MGIENDKKEYAKKLENLQMKFNILNNEREKVINEIIEVQGVLKYLGNVSEEKKQ